MFGHKNKKKIPMAKIQFWASIGYSVFFSVKGPNLTQLSENYEHLTEIRLFVVQMHQNYMYSKFRNMGLEK